jgi:hypothetical protein
MSIQDTNYREKRNIGKKLLIIIIMGIILYMLMKKLSENLHAGRIIAYTSFMLNIDVTTPYLHTGTIDIRTKIDTTLSISP